MTAQLVHALAMVLAMSVVAACAYALRLLSAHVKNGQVRDALLLLATLIGIGVRDAASEVAQMKDPAKPGEWGPEIAAAIKARVIADARAAAPAAARVLERAAAEPNEARALLSRLVEAEVATLKNGAG